jgi:Major Facilitator Superfamily
VGRHDGDQCLRVRLWRRREVTARRAPPERRGGKTGFVNGGFAYGAVPFIFIFSYALHPNTYVWVLDLVGVYMLVVVAICGLMFRDPPKNWWPSDVDPVQWANSKKGAESLRKNPPAVRQYTPLEAIKTGMLPLMWLSLGISAGVSLFGISYMVPFAKDLGFGGRGEVPVRQSPRPSPAVARGRSPGCARCAAA